MNCSHENKTHRKHMSPHWVCDDCGFTQFEGEIDTHARARQALVAGAAAATDHYSDDELEASCKPGLVADGFDPTGA